MSPVVPPWILTPCAFVGDPAGMTLSEHVQRSWVLGICAIVALLARVGFALYLSGTSRSKNSAGAIARLVCDLCVANLAFFALGAAVMFQVQNYYLWADWEFPPGGQPTVWQVFFFSVVILFATGVVPGAVAERGKFFTLCGATALLAGLVVPMGECWVERGWLGRLGYVDLAGASWVHVAGGVTAAVAAWMVGPRDGKYHRDGSASVIPGHNLPMAAAGVLLALVGWIPYVVGCQYWRTQWAWTDCAALNVLLSASAGGAAALLYGHLRYGKPDILLMLLGVLGGLVAITAAAGGAGNPNDGLPARWAVLIGGAAGVLVPWAAVWIDLIGRIDDPAGGVAVHAVGGAWGTLAAGVFGAGTFVDRLKHVGVQALGLVVIAAVAGGLAFGLFAVLKATVGLRAKEADEFDGLDLAEHDVGAYPDFQQNTIRSYHLREA